MTSPALRTILRQTPRQRFIRELLGIGGDVRLLWTPSPTDAAVSRSSEDGLGQLITWDATVIGRISQMGNGYAQTFAVASSQYGTMADSGSLSFGIGTADRPFSIVTLANVTNTAANREIASKNNTSNREWSFRVTSADVLLLAMIDESAGVTASRASDSAITQGSWRLFGATYTAATGGATAANDVTLYQDGAAIASTATNNAAYVAMENLGASVEIGSATAHTANFMDGSMALVMVVARALLVSEHLAIKTACNRYFGLTL